MTETVNWTPETLQKQLSENPYLRMIDVRSPAEYESVHIAGSYNIPMNTLQQHGARIRENVRDPIVFVCQSGKRASSAHEAAIADPQTQALVERGLIHIHVLQGGIKAWQAAGGKVRRGQDRWSMERQIRFIAGTIVLASIVASAWIPWTRWIAGFVGAGLTFAALTNFCAMESIVAKMPWNRVNRPDLGTIVDKLIGDMQHEKS